MNESTKSNLILALDTSADVCGVAVWRDGQFVTEHTFRHGMHLSERLFDHIDAVLKEADDALDDVSAFAVGLGPGSFTGTRIGVMTFKTLAAVQNKPLYGISSMDALVSGFRGLRSVVVVPLLPSRTGIIITGVYSVANDTPDILRPLQTLPLDDLAAQLRQWTATHVILCGPLTQKLGAELDTLLSRQGLQVSVVDAVFPRASEVGRLALARMEQGDAGDDALNLVPLYIAPPPISQPKPENRPPVYRERDAVP